MPNPIPRRTILSAIAGMPALFVSAPALPALSPPRLGRSSDAETRALVEDFYRSPRNVGPGIPFEIIEAEDAAAERLFAEVERTRVAHEKAHAFTRHIVTLETPEERRLWRATMDAESAWCAAEEALLRYPFVQAKHHRRKLAYIEASDHVGECEEDLETLNQSLLQALAIIHGDFRPEEVGGGVRLIVDNPRCDGAGDLLPKADVDEMVLGRVVGACNPI